jgi:ferredoxin
MEDGTLKITEDLETKKFKNKPDNYRLACQTLVNGPVTVITKP